MNFKPLLFLALSSLCGAEVLTLVDKDRFTGTLLSISKEDGLLVKSERSPEPISFRADSFSLLELEGPNQSDPFQTERLVLANGDILPGNLMQLDQDKIVYEGLVGGRIEVARDQVTTLRFGIKPQSLQYDGPAPLKDWDGSGVENWIMNEDPHEGLLVQESGQMSQDVGLGSQFIIKFDLKWQERPSLRIYFGQGETDSSQKNRYYIDLNSAGLQVKREQTAEPRWRTLVSLNRVEAFDDNAVSVEIRVNRLVGSLDLYLDGKLVRQMQDSFPPTIGRLVSISRNRSENSASYLTDFKIYSWDAVSQIELMEEPGDGKTDSLVDAEGKRMSGTLLRLVRGKPDAQTETTRKENATPEKEENAEPEPNTEEEKVPEQGEAPEEAPDEKPAPGDEGEITFLFKSPFAESPLEVPANRTRIIYFKNPEQNQVPTRFPKYELKLVNEGVVSAKTLSLTDEQFTLNHPLLGELSIPRSAVKSIRYYPDISTED